MKPSKPLIVVSPDYTRQGDEGAEQVRLDFRYSAALAEMGADALIIPPHADFDRLVELADGWLITGGDDLPEELLGEPLHPEAKVANPRRIAAERALYRLFAQTDKPILGICFGCQFLNVIEGGTLNQHIPDLPSASDHLDTMHTITTEPGTRLREIIGETTTVASAHHQAIRTPAPGWRVAAKAKDGLIEAIEREGEPFRVGVQWHPERTADSIATLALFRAFVQAATRRAARAPRE